MLFQRTISLLRMAVACAILSTVAFLCIPLCDAFGEGIEKMLSIVIASVFWGLLMLEQVFFWMANRGRKKMEKSFFCKKQLIKGSSGLSTFGPNKEARMCYIVLCMSAVSTLSLVIFRVQVDWLVILSIALLLLSFNLHCILNGKNYRYIKAFYKIKKGEEKR